MIFNKKLIFYLRGFKLRFPMQHACAGALR